MFSTIPTTYSASVVIRLPLNDRIRGKKQSRQSFENSLNELFKCRLLSLYLMSEFILDTVNNGVIPINPSNLYQTIENFITFQGPW